MLLWASLLPPTRGEAGWGSCRPKAPIDLATLGHFPREREKKNDIKTANFYEMISIYGAAAVGSARSRYSNRLYSKKPVAPQMTWPL